MHMCVHSCLCVCTHVHICDLTDIYHSEFWGLRNPRSELWDSVTGKGRGWFLWLSPVVRWGEGAPQRSHLSWGSSFTITSHRSVTPALSVGILLGRDPTCCLTSGPPPAWVILLQCKVCNRYLLLKPGGLLSSLESGQLPILAILADPRTISPHLPLWSPWWH